MPYTDNPAGNPLDAVRLFVGDKSTTAPDLSDNEIAFLIAEEGDVLRAAARAAETLSAKYTKVASERVVGPLRITQGTRALTKSQEFGLLAKRLWARAARHSIPYAGGIDIVDKQIRGLAAGTVQPAFRRRMMRYPNGEINSVTPEEILSSSEITP